jgi:hypothetical protein
MRSPIRLACPVAALAGLVLAPAAPAAFIPIANAGFENPALANNAFTTTVAPGWTQGAGVGATGVHNPPAIHYLGEAPEGSNVAYTNFTRAIFQTLSATLQAGSTYTLTVLVGDRLDVGFAGYAVELLAGSTVVASDTNGFVPANGAFQLSTVTYTAGAGDPFAGQVLGIRLRATAAAGNPQAAFDDVKLFEEPGEVVPVPAPPAAVLFGLGFAGLGLNRLRRRAGTAAACV